QEAQDVAAVAGLLGPGPGDALGREPAPRAQQGEEIAGDEGGVEGRLGQEGERGIAEGDGASENHGRNSLAPGGVPRAVFFAYQGVSLFLPQASAPERKYGIADIGGAQLQRACPGEIRARLYLEAATPRFI